MTKENFTKFLNEKQRDSRLNEELFPRLRQDQIKALIDKYEPCCSNSNRSEATAPPPHPPPPWSRCFSPRLFAGLITPEGLLNFLMGPETSVVMLDRLAKWQDMTQPLPHYFIKSSHNTYLTGHPLPHTSPPPPGCDKHISRSLMEVLPSLQLVSSPACPPPRCTDSVCWLGVAAWSWTAGRANPQMKSPSLPTASP